MRRNKPRRSFPAYLISRLIELRTSRDIRSSPGDILVDHYQSTQHKGCTISRRPLTAETRFRRLLQIRWVKFKVCKSVHHHTFNWINQQNAATCQVYYLSFKYKLNMFRATCPSSGATTTAVAASGLPLELGDPITTNSTAITKLRR